MIIILKPVFEILTGDVAVCNNVLYNYLIMLVVGELAFQIAFSIVGDAYRADIISSKAAGSILHWLIRAVIYIAIAYLLRMGIWIYHFIISVPHWVWWLAFGIIIGGIAFITLFIFVKERAKGQRTKKE